MLFDSSLRKELARNFGAAAIVLVTVLVTMTLIRVLGQASRGNFNPADLMLVMGYTVVTFMPSMMSLALFIAVVMTLSRLYADSEMVIWFSSRIGLARLLPALLRFAWPVLLAIALLSLLALPWAKSQISELQRQFAQRNDLERIQPGQFQTSADGSRVFFVEKGDIGQLKANNVFVATDQEDKKTVISASKGYTELVGGDRFLILEHGQRLETRTDEPGVKVAEFEHYRMLVVQDPLRGRDSASLNARPTAELLLTPTRENLGELSMRLGHPLVALQLIIFALAYTRVNPRVSRTGNLIFSLMLFQILQNLINIGQSWIRQGNINFGVFMLLMHGSLLVIAVLWLALRHRAWDWRTLLPRQRRAALAQGRIQS
ncbi:LPS export ABC transporter permease LptF [Hylemonella gracilis]|uniref:Lipopolysaccharide export system permease protein LptF n=1 Tax=Hylemonella gracilis TaxID=80880 RepID=A0A4P6US01_9BURK|nr:LPS export ABC transporter permease LptF [Hylemonella gracilis]QBK06571.1 LPS export ABC transporter permease LptF [Hylemonella gracilis]